MDSIHKTKCAQCKKEADTPAAMRDWVWVRHGNDGVWLCCWHCTSIYASFCDQITAPAKGYTPSKDEIERMGE